jgi:hypothetical protein
MLKISIFLYCFTINFNNKTMKKQKFLIRGSLTLLMLLIIRVNLNAQEEQQDSKFKVGVDFYTNYIWRGTKLGTGSALQPSVKFEQGILTLGVWGSFDAHGYTETDPYISLNFPFGLNIGITDYYYPGLSLFDVTDSTGSHALEINAGFSKGGFSFSANYIVNEAGGAASAGGDKYFQAGYSFTNVSIFMGAGDGWHTSNGKFRLCNIGIGTSKTIVLSDKFSIPVTGQVIFNPDREQLFVVAGISF